MKESRIMTVNRYLIRLCLYLWATNKCFSITFIRELTFDLRLYRYGCEPKGFHVQVGSPVKGSSLAYHFP